MDHPSIVGRIDSSTAFAYYQPQIGESLVCGLELRVLVVQQSCAPFDDGPLARQDVD